MANASGRALASESGMPECDSGTVYRTQRPLLGASARKNEGIPIVSRAAIVRWRGRNGNVKPSTEVSAIRTAAYTDLVR